MAVDVNHHFDRIRFLVSKETLKKGSTDKTFEKSDS